LDNVYYEKGFGVTESYEGGWEGYELGEFLENV